MANFSQAVKVILFFLGGGVLFIGPFDPHPCPFSSNPKLRKVHRCTRLPSRQSYPWARQFQQCLATFHGVPFRGGGGVFFRGGGGGSSPCLAVLKGNHKQKSGHEPSPSRVSVAPPLSSCSWGSGHSRHHITHVPEEASHRSEVLTSRHCWPQLLAFASKMFCQR